MAVSLRQLSYFTALAEAGSFGRAAERVHVTQPALSQQVRELEASLGVELVERLPRGIRLTRAGHEVHARARQILSQVNDLQGAVRFHHGLGGRLYLGLIPTVAPYLLPGVLTDIRTRDVTLELRVHEAQTATVLRDLSEGRIDAAVIALPVPEPGFAAEPLFEDRFLLAGSAESLRPFEAEPLLTPAHVAPERLLLLDEGHCLAEQALEVCGLKHRQKTDLGASSLGTLTGLVAQGFGLTFLPEIAAGSETAGGQLVLARFSPPEPSRTIALVRRASSAGGAWFDDLAAILRGAGEALVAGARAAVPARAGAKTPDPDPPAPSD